MKAFIKPLFRTISMALIFTLIICVFVACSDVPNSNNATVQAVVSPPPTAKPSPKPSPTIEANTSDNIETQCVLFFGKNDVKILAQDNTELKTIATLDTPERQAQMLAAISDNKKYIYYHEESRALGKSKSIYRYEIETKQNIEIAKNSPISFQISKDGETCAILEAETRQLVLWKNGEYVGDLPKVNSYYLSKKGDRIYYLTVNNNLRYYSPGFGKTGIARNVTQMQMHEKTGVLYYIKDNNLYKKRGGEAVLIDRGVFRIQPILDDKEPIYYSKQLILNGMEIATDKFYEQDKNFDATQETNPELLADFNRRQKVRSFLKNNTIDLYNIYAYDGVNPSKYVCQVYADYFYSEYAWEFERLEIDTIDEDYATAENTNLRNYLNQKLGGMFAQSNYDGFVIGNKCFTVKMPDFIVQRLYLKEEKTLYFPTENDTTKVKTLYSVTVDKRKLTSPKMLETDVEYIYEQTINGVTSVVASKTAKQRIAHIKTWDFVFKNKIYTYSETQYGGGGEFWKTITVAENGKIIFEKENVFEASILNTGEILYSIRSVIDGSPQYIYKPGEGEYLLSEKVLDYFIAN